MGQLHIYHDAQSGKFFSSKQICRNPFHAVKKQKIYLDPWNPLNLEKGNSPVWDILISNTPNQISGYQESIANNSGPNPVSGFTDSEFTPIPPPTVTTATSSFPSQRKQESRFFSTVLEQITTFTTNLFKRETVCLQCGKHGKYVFPFTSKTSMLKKFLQLVHGSSTERNLRENICKIPTDSRRKRKVKSKRKNIIQLNTFKKPTVRNVSSSTKLSFDDQPDAILTNLTRSDNNSTIKLPNIIYISNDSSHVNVTIEKWWTFFVLASKGSSKSRVNKPLLRSYIKVKTILSPSFKKNSTNKNLWLMMPLYAKLNSNLRTSQPLNISKKEILKSSEIAESTSTLPKAEDTSSYNNSNLSNVAYIDISSSNIQASLSAETTNLLRARLLVENWNHRYYGGILF